MNQNTFRHQRLQMIRRAAEGESAAMPPAPVAKPAVASPRPRRRWGMVPLIPMRSEGKHPALPNWMFTTLRRM